MPAPSKQIAILGAGQIGSTFAYYLSAANHQVTLIARPASTRLHQLQGDRGVVLTDGKRATVTVADKLDETKAYDLLIVTLRQDLIAPILPAIQRSAAHQVQFMMGTFQPELVAPIKHATPERFLLGFPYIQAWMTQDGRVTPKFTPGQSVATNSQQWCNVFQAAGIPTSYEHDMHSRLRSQAVVASALMSACYQGQLHKGGATWSEAMLSARAANDGFTLVKRLGYPITSTMNRAMAGMPTQMLAGMLWGMSRNGKIRSLLAGGMGEARVLVNSMLQAGKSEDLLHLRALTKL